MNMKGTDDCIDGETVLCYFYSATKDLKLLHHQCSSINNDIKSFSHGYIWHHDEFSVNIPLLQGNNSSTDLPFCLTSSTYFGDNIDDEWFIVYIVFELTKKYPDLIVRLVDNDGEFLLIEVADHLPEWINPDTSQNRVYIHQNKLHIIPRTLADTDTSLSISEALGYIIKSQELTAAEENIQKALRGVIDPIAENYLNKFHSAMVNLPIDVATVLCLQPALIAPLVHSYCQHDVIDIKKCGKIKLEKNVTVKVKFTKCLYAMLLHAKPINGSKSYQNNKLNKKDIIGDKLTIGFQILAHQTENDIYSTKNYAVFIKNLENSGYFQNYLKHSKPYTNLLEKAKEFYSTTETPINSHLSQKINSMMKTTQFDEMKNKLIMKSTEEEDVSDNDDWLIIEPEQLNKILHSRYGKPANFKADDVDTADILTNRLSNFLNDKSDYEGIEHSQDFNSDKIEFDADDFMNSVEKMLKFMSTGGKNLSDDDSDDLDSDDNFNDNLINTSIDEELASKLKDSNVSNENAVLHNIKQSIKEEKGFSGPLSNVLENIGINKTDLLSDSDDD